MLSKPQDSNKDFSGWIKHAISDGVAVFGKNRVNYQT